MKNTPPAMPLPETPDDAHGFSAGQARSALLRAIAELAEPNADGTRVQTIRTLAQSLAQLTENDHDAKSEKILQRLELVEKRVDELEKSIPPISPSVVADALQLKFSGENTPEKPARNRRRETAVQPA